MNMLWCSTRFWFKPYIIFLLYPDNSFIHSSSLTALSWSWFWWIRSLSKEQSGQYILGTHSGYMKANYVAVIQIKNENLKPLPIYVFGSICLLIIKKNRVFSDNHEAWLNNTQKPWTGYSRDHILGNKQGKLFEKNFTKSVNVKVILGSLGMETGILISNTVWGL